MYGAEWWTMRNKEEDLMRRTEMRMLRWIVGVSKKDKVRNVEIKRRYGVEDIVEKVREARLRWFGHVSRRDDGGAVKDIIGMEVGGSRRRGRPKRKWMDYVKKDMEIKGLSMEKTKDRNSGSRPQDSLGWSWIKKKKKKRDRTKYININAEKYISILDQELLPAFDSGKLCCHSTFFMQDRVSCHTAKKTKDWLVKEGIKCLP